MTEKEKMLANQLYDPSDAELVQLRRLARNKMMEFNHLNDDELPKRKEILQITFEDGDTYRYVKSEKTIYKNKQKIAKDIIDFNAEQFNNSEKRKKYIEVNIKIGSNDEANYEKKIEYVLKYW